jgi:hypothetical protein
VLYTAHEMLLVQLHLPSDGQASAVGMVVTDTYSILVGELPEKRTLGIPRKR